MNSGMAQGPKSAPAPQSDTPQTETQTLTQADVGTVAETLAPVVVVAADANASNITLMKSIAASTTGGLMLTQDQGAALVAAGLASVDTTKVQGDTAFVSLTEAGKAAVASAQVVQAASQKTFTVRNDIPLPGKRSGGGRKGSQYPIETMELNQSFHVAKTEENPDPASRIASSLSNARIKFAIPVLDAEGKPVMEEHSTSTYKKGEDGKLAKDADGKRIVESTEVLQRPKTTLGRDWTVASVDASDPDGVGARVWRTL